MPKLDVTAPVAPQDTIRTSPEAFGAGSGRALQRFGQQVQSTVANVERIAEEGMRQRGLRSALEFEEKLATEARQIESEVFEPSTPGGDQFTERLKVFEERRSALLAEHRPPGLFARDFDQRTSLSSVKIKNDFEARVRTQQLAAARADFDSNFKALTMAAARETDPQQLAASVSDLGLFIEQGIKTGLVDEAEQNVLLEKAQRDVIRGITERLISDSPWEAEEFLESDQWIGSEVDRQEYLRRARASQEQASADQVTRDAQRTTDAIVDATVNPDAQLEMARAIEEPGLRDEVVSRVKIRQSEQEARKKRQQREVDDASENAISQGGGVDQILPGTTPSLKRTLIDWEEKRSKLREKKTGFVQETDPATYKRLSDMLIFEPDKFADYNLYRDRAQLTDDDFETFREERNKIRTDTKEGAVFSQGDSVFLNKTMRAAGIKDQGVKDTIWLEYHRMVKENPRMDREQKEKLADEIIKQVDVPNRLGLFFGSAQGFLSNAKRIGEFTPEDTARVVDTPPRWLVDQAQNELAAAGIPKSEQRPDEVNEQMEAILRAMGAPGAE